MIAYRRRQRQPHPMPKTILPDLVDASPAHRPMLTTRFAQC